MVTVTSRMFGRSIPGKSIEEYEYGVVFYFLLCLIIFSCPAKVVVLISDSVVKVERCTDILSL